MFSARVVVLKIQEGAEMESFLRLLTAAVRSYDSSAEDQMLGEQIASLINET